MKKVFLITLFLFSSFKVHSLEVTLTQGSVKPTPIAVTELYSKNSQLTKVGKNISTVISDNLERSGLFLSIDKKSPDLSKLSEITVEIFLPTFVICVFFEYSSVTAIGVGFTLPCVRVTSNEWTLKLKNKKKVIKKNFFINILS